LEHTVGMMIIQYLVNRPAATAHSLQIGALWPMLFRMETR
jgi:hypothetical protein